MPVEDRGEGFVVQDRVERLDESLSCFTHFFYIFFGLNYYINLEDLASVGLGWVRDGRF